MERDAVTEGLDVYGYGEAHVSSAGSVTRALSSGGASSGSVPFFLDGERSDEVEISWRLDTRAARRIRRELGLNPISWCETPSPDAEVQNGNSAFCNDSSTVAWSGRTAAVKASRKKVCRAPRAVKPVAKPEPWGALSHEMILHIFKYLDPADLVSCARVSRSWRQIAYDDSLWREIIIHEKRIPPKLVFFAIQRNPRTLTIANCDMIDFEDDEGDVTVSRTVYRDTISCTRLDLSCTRIFDHDAIHLLKMAPTLRVLDLGNSTVTDRTLFAIAKFCPKLDALNLRMVQKITETGIQAITRGCPNLRTLSLGWATSSEHFGRQIARNCHNLEHLDLSGCWHEMTDALVGDIVRAAPGLKTLDLSDCYELTEVCIDHIVNHLHNLTTVSLSRNHLITLPAMLKLTGVNTLKNINLFGCYPDVMPEIKATRRHLLVNEQALTCLPPFM